MYTLYVDRIGLAGETRSLPIRLALSDLGLKYLRIPFAIIGFTGMVMKVSSHHACSTEELLMLLPIWLMS